MAYTDHRFDRELFHAWLWDTRKGQNIISMTQAEMADILMCSAQTPSRMMQELIAADKVVKIRNGTYKVKNPSDTKILK